MTTENTGATTSTESTSETTSTAPVSDADRERATQEANAAFTAALGETPQGPTKDVALEPAKKPAAQATTGSTPASSTTPPAKEPAASTEGPKFAGFSEAEMKQILDRVPENSRQHGELTKQIRQINGWIGSINEQLKKLPGATSSAAAPAAAASAPRKEINSEAMKKLKDDLPDVYQAIMDSLAAVSTTPGGPSKEELEQLVTGRVASEIAGFRAEEMKRQQRALFKVHPDIREAAAKAAKGTELGDLLPGFRLWLSAQPVEFQKELNDADDWSTVSDAFTKFKDSQKTASPADEEARKAAEAERARQNKRLERAAAPTGVPASSNSNVTAQQAFDAAFGPGTG